MKRIGLAAALGIIVLVNAFVLGRSAWNRAGDPSAVVILTERELLRPRRFFSIDRENTGLALTLLYKGPGRFPFGAANWFDREKLRELGFDLPWPLDDPRTLDRLSRSVPAREAWAVLEYEGEGWREFRQGILDSVEQVRKEEKEGRISRETADERVRRLETQLETSTRLFVVDMGLDPAALRKRYPDRSRTIVARASYDISFESRRDENRQENVVTAVHGYVRGLSVSSIHVPRRFKEAFTGADQDAGRAGPRYRVTLAYGRLREPWIVAVEPEP